MLTTTPMQSIITESCRLARGGQRWVMVAPSCDSLHEWGFLLRIASDRTVAYARGLSVRLTPARQFIQRASLGQPRTGNSVADSAAEELPPIQPSDGSQPPCRAPCLVRFPPSSPPGRRRRPRKPSAQRRRRRLRATEGLEDRVLLSGNPTYYTVNLFERHRGQLGHRRRDGQPLGRLALGHRRRPTPTRTPPAASSSLIRRSSARRRPSRSPAP